MAFTKQKWNSTTDTDTSAKQPQLVNLPTAKHSASVCRQGGKKKYFFLKPQESKYLNGCSLLHLPWGGVGVCSVLREGAILKEPAWSVQRIFFLNGTTRSTIFLLMHRTYCKSIFLLICQTLSHAIGASRAKSWFPWNNDFHFYGTRIWPDVHSKLYWGL